LPITEATKSSTGAIVRPTRRWRRTDTRGARPKAPAKQRDPWFTVAIVALIIVLVVPGNALFL
jgi:hypothetical protein